MSTTPSAHHRPPSDGGRLTRLSRTLPGSVARRYAESGSGNWAAAIALNLLLSLFPIVLAILFVASLVLRDPSSRDSALAQVARIAPGGSSGSGFQELTSVVDAVRQSTGLIGVLALASLVWGGSGLFGCIEQAFARVMGFTPRPFLKGKLMAMGMVLVYAVLVVVALGASSALAVLTPIGDRLDPSGGSSVLGGPVRYLIQIGVGVVTGLLLFSCIYVVVPRGRHRLRDEFPGAILAACLFEALSLVWPIYIAVAGGSNRYGQTVGLLLVIVSYVYVLAQILMLGAVFNVERAHRRSERALSRAAAQAQEWPPAPAVRPHPKRWRRAVVRALSETLAKPR